MPILIINHKGKAYKCLYSKQDHELISRYTWCLHSKGYVKTTIAGKSVLMHRMILGVIDHPEIEVDHRFHNRLDNRRSKIRTCTHSENLQNSRKLTPGSSKFKGVYRDGKYFHSQIKKLHKTINLGRYHSEITAAKIYDKAAIVAFEEFACLNFPKSEYVQQSIIPGF